MPSSTAFRITIVGGGIAGLTAAIALRAPNRQIVVLEQSSLHKEIGATISLQPNASKILDQTLDVGSFLQEARGMIDRGFRVFSSDGTMVNEIPLVYSQQRYGAERMMYHRQDLHNALKRAATAEMAAERGPPATIRTSAKAISCDCETGAVSLADGTLVHGDLIIAADGIHSNLRESIIGQTITPKPTGLSAYRLVKPHSELQSYAPAFCEKIDPTAPYTSMMLAHSCRLIMSPARDGEIFGVVGLVPDERMDEDPNSAQSWRSTGDPEKMLQTFAGFPEWSLSAFKNVNDLGLWQLRDIDPLSTWTKGRAILIGDAAHAMLPTQGQGASQSVEDAEALGSLFASVDSSDGPPSQEAIQSLLADVFESRYERATLIQKYSRESAKPATEEGKKEINMRPDEFMAYNCSYNGAKAWLEQQRHAKSKSERSAEVDGVAQ